MVATADAAGLRDARQALSIANAVRADLNTHEAVCAERYKDMREAINDLSDWIRRAMIGSFTLLIGMLGFLIVALLRKNGWI